MEAADAGTRVSADPATVARALAGWFAGQARDLPWRRTRDPYHVLLSEFLLQQTRMEVGLRYYDRFLARFPTVESLAAAPSEEVQRLWSGLGYYRRARYLHAAARQIVDAWGGRVPDDPAALRTLPGVGPYTAGAVASIAYGRPEPSLDGNQVRVYGRLLGLSDAGPADPRVASFARRVLRHGAPGDLNQALMDLGSAVCRPAAASCDACPLAHACASRGRVAPVRAPAARRARAPVEDRDVVLRVRGGRLWLEAPRERGLLAGLWLPPMRAGRGRGWRPDATHVFSHRTWRLRWRRAEGRGAAPGRWVSAEELEGLPHGALTRRAFAAAGLTGDARSPVPEGGRSSSRGPGRRRGPSPRRVRPAR